MSNEGCFPVLMDLLIKSHIITLGSLIHITEHDLSDTKAMEEKLKMRSTRVVTQLLSKWKEIINKEEFKMIKDVEEGWIQQKDVSIRENVLMNVSCLTFSWVKQKWQSK